ncbi:hypothetical protein EDB19DRAFT_1094499 [Suillus lakei]|nr:hypothetical protein EDB19DRAFT_1094499 [Suillus lakei]
MFMGTVWALTYKCRIRDINPPIAVVAILLFIISTAHIVVDILRAEEGLVMYRDTFPGRASRVLRRHYPKIICNQACVIPLADSPW